MAEEKNRESYCQKVLSIAEYRTWGTQNIKHKTIWYSLVYFLQKLKWETDPWDLIETEMRALGKDLMFESGTGTLFWERDRERQTAYELRMSLNKGTRCLMFLRYWVDWLFSKTGVPNPQFLLGTGPHGRNGVPASKASSVAPHRSHYCLNLPRAPTTVCGRIVFHKTGRWCQKGWAPLL